MVYKNMIFKVKAILKWKGEFIIILEGEGNGRPLYLGVENQIEAQVKTGDVVVGDVIDGVVHINDFVNL